MKIHHLNCSSLKPPFSDNFANRIMGGYIKKLRSLLASRGEEIKAISAYDVFSFKK